MTKKKQNNTEELVRLSASRIQSFFKCSWVYYVTYVLKLRDGGNSGSSRGSLVHSVFEVLLKEKRKKYFNKIVENNDVFCVPSIKRYILSLFKKDEWLDKVDNKGNDNLELIKEMLLVGLNYDFYCDSKGGKVEMPEMEFDYTEENGQYRINGFIDKVSKNKDGSYEIWDYKSSASKYNEEEMEFPVQALMYQLYLYKLERAKSVVNFLFLRFADNPVVKHEFNEGEILGFEQYLGYLSEFLKDFDAKKGMTNFAKSKGFCEGFAGMVVCGMSKYPGHLKKDGKPYYHCAFKFPFVYYELQDKTGKIIASNKDKTKLKMDKYTKIVEKKYGGCPAWSNLIHDNPEKFVEFLS